MTPVTNLPNTGPITLKIDHVTIAGPDLHVMERSFAAIGLATDYGGPHAALTHMAILGFDDGSYIELISSQDPVENSPQLSTHHWGKFIAGNAGPCAWAVEVDDVARESARVAALGIPVTGPLPGSRRRPDGTLVEWDTAVLGPGPPGATLPFIIKDRTPRGLRVQRSASVSGLDENGEPRRDRLTGVSAVVLGVDDLEDAAGIFRLVYNWPAPIMRVNDAFAATLAYFPGTPVVLAASLKQGDWLDERLTRFGPAPCAYLIGAASLEDAATRFHLTASVDWFGRRAMWFDAESVNDTLLGIVEQPEP
jgi:hypothetical protein